VGEMDAAGDAGTPGGVYRDRLLLILRAVAREYGAEPGDMLSPSRPGRLVQARQAAWLLLRKRTRLSLPQIGARFGRDHSTVLHGVRKMEALMRANPLLRERLAAIEAQLDHPQESSGGKAAGLGLPANGRRFSREERPAEATGGDDLLQTAYMKRLALLDTRLGAAARALPEGFRTIDGFIGFVEQVHKEKAPSREQLRALLGMKLPLPLTAPPRLVFYDGLVRRTLLQAADYFEARKAVLRATGQGEGRQASAAMPTLQLK
jgi:Bacterial dnaA protein helix-turn-helix